jgi:hypothetical protein
VFDLIKNVYYAKVVLCNHYDSIKLPLLYIIVEDGVFIFNTNENRLKRIGNYEYG